MSFAVQVINIVLGVIALWVVKKVTEEKPLGRPIPGPKGWPIISNLLDVPSEVEYVLHPNRDDIFLLTID